MSSETIVTNETAVEAQRNFKDTVFRALFNDKKALLSLYNALNGTDHTDPEVLEINTLERAIFIGVKNDISFVIDSQLTLYEHQSTFNANMPMRDLLYVADLYSKMIPEKELYRRSSIKVPVPQFITFYNGTEEQPERKLLHLSDLYDDSGKKMIRENTEKMQLVSMLELDVLVININKGCSEDLKKGCRLLGEYMIYVDRVRKYTPLCGLNEAVRRAVNECIDEGVLEEFLRRNRSEVIKMSIYEYNRELHMQVIAEEEREEGKREGKIEGKVEGKREGKIEGKIDSLLMILHTKGEIPDELAVLIRGVKDEQILTRWTELALKTTSVEEFEETIKL